MARIVPLATTTVNYSGFLSCVTEHTGHTPSKGTDASSSQFSDHAKYIASLGEFQAQRITEPRKVIRCPGPWLRHTFFSMLIIESASTMLKISEATDLDILSVSAKEKKQRVAVVSGNLDVWRNAIIICTSKQASTVLRSLFNEIKVLFDKIGLQDLWYGYSIKEMTDGTYTLEYNP